MCSDMDTVRRSAAGSDAELQTEIQELISTLPSATDVIFQLSVHKYKHFWFHQFHLEGILGAENRFVAQPQDIIICSFLKTGTTWVKALAFATATRAQFEVESATHPLLTNSPHDCVPFVELELGKVLASRQRFPILATHAPYSVLPESVRSSACKIIYVWRDPKDVFVSLLHYASGVKWGKELDTSATPIDEAFCQFCHGVFTSGPYWDHVIEFLRASQEQPRKVLCLRYEDLKNETSDCVRRLAEFISQSFSPKEEKRGTVEKIVELCSFENLRSLEPNRNGEYRSEVGQLVVRNTLFYRKGEVGDWKNHLSDDMAARLDNIFREKLAEAGLQLPPP